MPLGSKAALIAPISSSSTGLRAPRSAARFITPMPCSAEIEPPQASETALTAAWMGCQSGSNWARGRAGG